MHGGSGHCGVSLGLAPRPAHLLLYQILALCIAPLTPFSSSPSLSDGSIELRIFSGLAASADSIHSHLFIGLGHNQYIHPFGMIIPLLGTPGGISLNGFCSFFVGPPS